GFVAVVPLLISDADEQLVPHLTIGLDVPGDAARRAQVRGDDVGESRLGDGCDAVRRERRDGARLKLIEAPGVEWNGSVEQAAAGANNRAAVAGGDPRHRG